MMNYLRNIIDIALIIVLVGLDIDICVYKYVCVHNTFIYILSYI